MDWNRLISEMLDLRSFASMWYWIVLVAVWTAASHRVLGVPYGLVLQARRGDDRAAADVAAIVAIAARRQLCAARRSGPWLAGAAAFGLTVLAILGFGYRVEFCQAVFLLAAPMAVVALLSLRTAALCLQHGKGATLYDVLRGHRLVVRLFGMLSILLTVLWGMWWNLTASVLGG